MQAGQSQQTSSAAATPEGLSLVALRELAVKVDRSLGAVRDPAEAALAWTSLLEGRSLLIDQFDVDGRRYFIVRRREHKRSPLSPRERQVLYAAASGSSGKHIAYELGISQSTVALHLKSAAKKLGYRSRVSLVMAVAAARRSSPDHCRGSPPR